MKQIPPRLLRPVLLLAAGLLLASCASEEDLRAALHDYNDGRMSYDARRKSKMEANMERTDTRINHLAPNP